jgi:hypothetical protein
MKSKSIIFLSLCLASLFPFCKGEANTLSSQYERASLTASDINQHVPLLYELAKECPRVTEIGIRGMVSTWGILYGLSQNPSSVRSYTGIDLFSPPIKTLALAEKLAKEGDVQFNLVLANDMTIDIQQTDFLFIDSLHTYAHLTYELEKFSSQVTKYIAMHDTSGPWGTRNDSEYRVDYSEYPSSIDRSKKGLWAAVEDFLANHPEWALAERHLNCNGFTILERIYN